ncbi:hypothetical protein GEMRC1_010954 [Eukaryota sp. GEM-RC1]
MYTFASDNLSTPSPDRLERFKTIVRDYEISEDMSMHLRKLERFDIVVIADDSGSMLTPLCPPSSTAPSMTRWEELKQQIQIITKLATCLDSDGIDLYFLNRTGMNNVTEPEQVEALLTSLQEELLH